jgi:hypothetical protein
MTFSKECSYHTQNAATLPSSSRGSCLYCRAAAALLVALPLTSLPCCRCLHHHAAALFIAITMPLSSSPSQRHCLQCRAAAAFFGMTTLPSLSQCRCLHYHNATLFIAVMTISTLLLPSPRCCCLPCCDAATFTVTPPLPPSSRHRSLHCHHNPAVFIVTTPLPSLPSQRSCLHCCAAAAFIATTLLPSPLRRHCLQSRHCLHCSSPLRHCLDRQAAAAFLVVGNQTSDDYTTLSL